jgi:hypothetical protein
MASPGGAVILGRRELKQALDQLPAKVAKKVFDVWTIDRARAISRLARKYVPRDKRRPRVKPESARLWKSIKASPVRNLKKFKGTISRAIAYGATTRGARAYSRSAAKFRKRNERRARRGEASRVWGMRARHFHLVVRGTTDRVQTSTGRRTGRMWGKTANPQFWEKAAREGLAMAQGEVGAQLRNAYDKALQRHLNLIMRQYARRR